MPKIYNLMFFDASTTTGWAAYISPVTLKPTSTAFVPSGCTPKIESGVEGFKTRRGESSAMRFHYFSLWIGRVLDKYRPCIVGYEQPFFRGGFASDLLVGFVTRIQEECAKRGIEYTKVEVATLKKFTTGNGRAQKSDMIAAIHKKYPEIEIIDDNHADALAGLSKLIHDFITPNKKGIRREGVDG